ncbi:hypothetical protein E2C01_100174 [Portunus trituberculatus]|uniref:Uncharacterized protein n=1 Tax=Portunus trituberculatus TaxID=210409 RepID=A0A5B7K7C7_PORTR|nr:hypothetical protein [Portunus trituberculatus]
MGGVINPGCGVRRRTSRSEDWPHGVFGGHDTISDYERTPSPSAPTTPTPAPPPACVVRVTLWGFGGH